METGCAEVFGEAVLDVYEVGVNDVCGIDREHGCEGCGGGSCGEDGQGVDFVADEVDGVLGAEFEEGNEGVSRVAETYLSSILY